MDLMDYLQQIQQLLRVHDRAVRQILVLDRYMSTVSRQAFYSAMDGNFVQVMHLLLRKSVAEGIKKMMKVYRLRKWFTLQNVVQKASRYIQQRQGIDIVDYMDEFHQFPYMGRLSKEDIAAQSWTVLDIEFYRQP